VAVDTQQVETLPVPDDFPVDWESGDEQRLSFMFSQDHFPRPVTPLDFAFFRDVGEHSVGAVCEHYDAPITGWHIRRFGTYLYQANLPFRGSPEEADARLQRSEEKTMRDIERLAERWDEETLPEVRQHLDWWDSFDLEGASLDALIDHFDETWRRGIRCWELHFLTIVPAYVALSEFEELYRQLFGEASALDPWKALQGTENKTTEVASGLWQLSRLAVRSDAVLAALARDDAGQIVAALEEGDDGRAFLAELRGFLDRYGRRTDTWVLSAPSWIEDPTLVLKNVRDLTERADGDAPAITTTQAAQEREQHVRTARERLGGYPAPVRETFEKLMKAAREAAVIQDDHNFWIDFCVAYRMRRVMLEVGRRFADAGAIESADDVFMLTPEELRETAGRLGAGVDHRALVAERRAEMAAFEDYDPPRHLGAATSGMRSDNPVTRFMTKFYGIPPAPSDRPDVVTGLPGAAGRARGVARVIRSLSEIDRLAPGEVLVTETTAPPWTPVFATAAAVVTDSGGVLSHAAVVAREYGIPAVVGTAVATTALEDGRTVEVDGAAGTVTMLDGASSWDGQANGDRAPAAAPAPAPASEGAGAPGAVEPGDAARFVEEAQLRNEDIVTEAEQGLVNSLRVLIAGCGSVGGSAVEPLVRLGVGELILADPDDYALNNINRQAATVSDVGRRKVDVHAERARAINPFVRVTTLAEGLTEENVERAVLGSTIVFDGVDPSPGPMQVKYLMHKYAARHRIPVLTGVDLGGKPTLYVYDYRVDSRPFYGKANAEAFREGRLFEAIVPLIGLRNLPSDFIPIVMERASSESPPDESDKRLMDRMGWPQVSYCTAALGAITTRTIIDVASGRDVPHVVTVDLHQLTRTPRERRAERLRRPLVLGRTVQALRRAARDGAPRPAAERKADPLRAVPESLIPILEAMRHAPSAHNTQPWTLEPDGADRVRLGYDPMRRLDVADRDGRYLCHSLGCAVEAANAVAEVEWEPGSGLDPLEPGWSAGELVAGPIRLDDYRVASGLLASRGTNRAPYLTHRIDRRVLSRFEAAGDRFGAQVYTVDSSLTIHNFGKFAAQASMAPFAHDPYVDELLEWIRFSRREPDWDADGFTPETLALTGGAKAMLRQMKANPRFRRAAMRAKLPPVLAYLSTGVVKQSAALVLIATRTSSPRAWIDAGRAMMAIWLEATRENLAVQPVSFAIDYDELKPMVIQAFGASMSDQPAIVLRIGRPTRPTPQSPRLPLRRLVRTPA